MKYFLLIFLSLNAHAVGNGGGGHWPPHSDSIVKSKTFLEEVTHQNRVLRFYAESLHPFSSLGFIYGFFGVNEEGKVLVRQPELVNMIPGRFAVANPPRVITSGEELKATAAGVERAFRGSRFEEELLGKGQELHVKGRLRYEDATGRLIQEKQAGLMDGSKSGVRRLGHLETEDLEKLGAVGARSVFDALSKVDIYDDLTDGVKLDVSRVFTDVIRLREISGGGRETQRICERAQKFVELVKRVRSGKLVQFFEGMAPLHGQLPVIVYRDLTFPVPMENCDAI